MKYRNLYFIVLTSIFKSCVMLSCYDCFSCPYIKDYITVFECKKGESCLTIVMAGETFQDGYSTVVHRQCQRGDMSWDGTPLGIDWYYWAESYCSSHHSEIAQVDICLAIHCETDLCNNLPVENLTMTTVTASTTGTTSITGPGETKPPLLYPDMSFDLEGHNKTNDKKKGRSRGSRCSVHTFVMISFIISLF